MTRAPRFARSSPSRRPAGPPPTIQASARALSTIRFPSVMPRASPPLERYAGSTTQNADVELRGILTRLGSRLATARGPLPPRHEMKEARSDPHPHGDGVGQGLDDQERDEPVHDAEDDQVRHAAIEPAGEGPG